MTTPIFCVVTIGKGNAQTRVAATSAATITLTVLSNDNTDSGTCIAIDNGSGELCLGLDKKAFDEYHKWFFGKQERDFLTKTGIDKATRVLQSYRPLPLLIQKPSRWQGRWARGFRYRQNIRRYEKDSLYPKDPI